jgi:hypothetical protein
MSSSRREGQQVKTNPRGAPIAIVPEGLRGKPFYALNACRARYLLTVVKLLRGSVDNHDPKGDCVAQGHDHKG